MQIAPGKFGVLRDGRIVGPLETGLGGWAWRAKDHEEGWMHWKEHGHWFGDKHESPFDIIDVIDDKEPEYLKSGEEEEKVELYGNVKISQSEPMTKRSLLELAIEATSDRGLNYGKPEDNFARIASLWNAHLFNRGIIDHPEDFEGKLTRGPLTPGDVAMMCALLKIARLENTPGHKDSWVDLAGYAACGAEIELNGTESK